MLAGPNIWGGEKTRPLFSGEKSFKIGGARAPFPPENIFSGVPRMRVALVFPFPRSVQVPPNH